MKIKSNKSEQDIINHAYSKGIKLVPLSQFYVNSSSSDRIFIMNYSSINIDYIDEVVQIMNTII